MMTQAFNAVNSTANTKLYSLSLSIASSLPQQISHYLCPFVLKGSYNRSIYERVFFSEYTATKVKDKHDLAFKYL